MSAATISVRNIPETCTEQELSALFSICGTVVECKIAKNEGFVRLSNIYISPNVAHGQAAILTLNNYNFQGCHLTAIWTIPQEMTEESNIGAVVSRIPEEKPCHGRPIDRIATKKLQQRIQILKNKNLNLKKRLEMQQICKTCIVLRIEKDFLDRKCKKYEEQMEEQSAKYGIQFPVCSRSNFECKPTIVNFKITSGDEKNLSNQAQEEIMWLRKLVSHLKEQISQKDLLLTGVQQTQQRTLNGTAQEPANVPNLLPFYDPCRGTIYPMMSMTEDHGINPWLRIAHVAGGGLQKAADIDPVQKERVEEDSLYERCRIAVEREESLLLEEEDMPVDSMEPENTDAGVQLPETHQNQIESADQEMRDEEESLAENNLILGEGRSVGALVNNFVRHSLNNAVIFLQEASKRPEEEESPLTCMWVSRDNKDGPRKKCGKELRTSREFASHFKEKHLLAAGLGGLVCLWKGCNRRKVPFRDTYNLTHHFQTHFGQGPFQCQNDESCTLTFPSWRAARIHMATHMNTKYPCKYPGCDQKFKSKHEMMVHFWAKHMSKGDCGKGRCRGIAVERGEDMLVDSTSSSNMSANLGKRTEEESSAKNNLHRVASESLESAIDEWLANVESEEEESETRPLACKWVALDHEDRPRKCGKVSRTIAEFAAHFEDQHLEPAKGRMVCLWEGCNRGPYITEFTLSRHVHAHFDKGPYHCPHEECPLTFSCYTTARNHVYTHTKTKYPCKYPGCGQKFKSKSNMMVHYRAKHMDIGKGRRAVRQHCRCNCC